MKLWNKGYKINKRIEEFTVGQDKELDLYLAEYDIIGSLAHCKMLHSIGLLSQEELTLIEKQLKAIYINIKKGDFTIEDGVEDVHSQVEILLTKKLGDAGKKIHTGRSRNDQVLVDIRLFIRKELQDIVFHVKSLFDTLINLSNQYQNILMPGYTHFQVAMPSSFGLWFGAYAESLTDDMQMLLASHKIVNQNPLGSGAGYGSSFPLNRQMTAELLGFDNLNYNVVYAQMGRGKIEKITAYSLATVGATLSKLAMDVCLFMGQNYDFFSFPDEYTTGSSIMPHKKNPDVFELVRARGNKLQALPNEIALITSNLPSGYHRDMQLLKENLFPACNELKFCLAIVKMALDKIEINPSIIKDKRYQYLFTVEEVNRLVLKGIPFRDAYKKVAEEIKSNSFKPQKNIIHTHEGSIGNLCNEKIENKMEELLRVFPFDSIKEALDKLME